MARRAVLRGRRRTWAGMWRIFSAVAGSSDIAGADLTLFNRWKKRAARHCRIVRDGEGVRRRRSEKAPPLERAVRLIAEAAEDLLPNGRLDRLRICGGDNCEWISLDISKNGQRRWRSMASCGNDAKGGKHRMRRKKTAV